MEELFVQVTRRAEGKRPKLTASGWSEVLQDLFELRRLIPVVGLDACIEILCESLLCSEEDNLHLVRDIFNYRPADALFKTKSALLYVLSVHKVALVALKSKEKSVSAACEFFLDSSKDLDDPNLEVAQKCLDLVSAEESPVLQKYHDILSGLLMLRDFGVSILPIVLRNTTNFLPIVQKILQIDGKNYKNARKILRMIRLLRPDLEVKEAPILTLIADEALKTKDFDYCLSICELMMERPSSEACKVCLHLLNTEDFADLTAKAKLSAFCVNYCDDDLIEDMIFQRLHLQEEQDLNIVKPLAASFSSNVAIASEDNAMKGALSKLTKDNFIPDSTKVISSLFGKLSNVITQKAAEDDDDKEERDDELSSLSLSENMHVKGQKSQKISINAFYEDIYDSHNIGLLHSSLDSYASTVNGSPLDKATLALISKHYRNFYQAECSAEHSIDWVVLRDILAIILEEDTALGMSLMLAEMEHHSDFMADFINTTRRPQIGLYAAALYCAIKSWPTSSSCSSSDSRQRQKIVDFPPGFLYCCVKTLGQHEGLLRGKSEQVLQKALSRVKCDNE